MSEENGTYDISYNLFSYGYKELTQDAFICWLIRWAYYDGTGYEELKKCGQDFVKALFKKHGKEAPHNLEPDKVKIWQQDNSIDVLAKIGDYVLLIEDKTGTGDHSEQLERYYHIVSRGDSAAGEVDEGNIIPIYLKTGNQSLRDKLRIESTEYKVFERKDFLMAIKPYNEAHPIIGDFYNHLVHREAATNSYEKWRENGSQSEEVNYWSSCQGFFRKLEDQLCALNDDGLVGFHNKVSAKPAQDTFWGWDYVSNQAGGFIGFWWYYRIVKSCGCDIGLYLQLEIKPQKPESGKLCVKVESKTPDTRLQSEIKWDCHGRVLKAGNNLLRKPDVMRRGYTMTVAQWDDKEGQDPWLVFKTGGGLDIQETVNNLIKAQDMLDRVEDIAL